MAAAGSLGSCPVADAEAAEGELLDDAATGRPAPRAWGRSFRLAAGAATLLGLIFAAAAAALSTAEGRPSVPEVPPDVAAAVQEWGAAQTWLVCKGDDCGAQEMQGWRVNPAELAGRVGSLDGVPGGAVAALTKWRSSPPSFQGEVVTLESLQSFMKELLTSDPFGTGAEVPYLSFQQGGEKSLVAVTQRQLAFIVANALVGNALASEDGLSQALQRCGGSADGQIVVSLLSMLAVLSHELAGGLQGSTLIGAMPGALSNEWMNELVEAKMSAPTVCDKLSQGSSLSCGLNDFMAGGNPRQAMVDIAGAVVGGGAQMCELAMSQDESLVQFYGEVLAFSFFVTTGEPKMIPVPFVLLGARPYMSGISGESKIQGKCGEVAAADWLNQDIIGETALVPLKGTMTKVAASAFVAVASKSSAADQSCSTDLAVNNQCPNQRNHLEADVGLWYQAFEPSMYPEAMQQAFSGTIQSIGTGPWGAGVWYGDSQQYFLAVWLATTLLSHKPRLDYYIYDHFCENPGNQCFVLGGDGCAPCISEGGEAGKIDKAKLDASRCGTATIHDMIKEFAGREGLKLYHVLNPIGNPPAQVFDIMHSLEPTLDSIPLITPVFSTPAPPTEAPAQWMPSMPHMPVYPVYEGGQSSPGLSPRVVVIKLLGAMAVIIGVVMVVIILMQTSSRSQYSGMQADPSNNGIGRRSGGGDRDRSCQGWFSDMRQFMLLPSTTGQLPPGPGAWGSGSYSSYYGPGGAAATMPNR